MLRICALIFSLSISFFLNAQSINIPGYTGYAVPAETNETSLFSEQNGLQKWSDAKKQISYFFYVKQPGELSVILNAKNPIAGNTLKVSIAGKDFLVSVPASQTFKKLKAGNIVIQDTGFYTLTLSVVKKAGPIIADIQSIDLSGTAVAGMRINTKPRRNAASVHLRYPLADTVAAIAFYNEITVPAGADPVHSYYMACGFSRGYLGIQVNSIHERRVIFSVWDAGSESADRSKVADVDKVQLLAKGEDVLADAFGNEGTGGHSHWVYPWKTEQTYKVLVTALADSATQTTIYTGYFFLPEQQKWKLIASFKAPKDGHPLDNLYSFSENFSGVNGQLQRKVFFGNQWVQRINGQWMELTKSSFSYDATAKAGDRMDYGGGTRPDGKFYLWNGGFKKSNVAFGDVFMRPATQQPPVIDWTKNADSTKQAVKEREMIFTAIKTKQVDTTGSKDGVYYQILKEGNGVYVSVNDTLTVFYKGTLLKDGSIFDQTKDKPATFPLKRLIKGWQIALPLCRVGGKIRVFIPSALGYTIRTRSKAIPPNSLLVFDVEVVSVNN